MPNASGLTTLVSEDALAFAGGTKEDAQSMLSVAHLTPANCRPQSKVTALTSETCHTEQQASQCLHQDEFSGIRILSLRILEMNSVISAL